MPLKMSNTDRCKLFSDLDEHSQKKRTVYVRCQAKIFKYGSSVYAEYDP